MNRLAALALAILALGFAVIAVISWVDPDVIVPSSMTWGVWISLAPVGSGLAISLTMDAIALWKVWSGRPAAVAALWTKVVLVVALVVLCVVDTLRYLPLSGIAEATGPFFFLAFPSLWLAIIIVSFVATVHLLRSYP